MSFLFLVLLLLAVLVCALWRKRRAAQCFTVLAIASLIGIGCGLLPTLLLQRLQQPYIAEASRSWSTDNAIVLLGAGTVATGASIEPELFAYGRIDKAAAIYRECRSAAAHCRLIISGGDARRTGISEAALYQQYLSKLGVPEADMVQESSSMNTWQNAEFTSRLLRAKPGEKVWLVSSGAHLQRGLRYFAHFGISAHPVRADYLSAHLSILPLAINFTVMDVAMHEEIGLLRYALYESLGWNATSSRPGAV
ncbi:YdcF family protein [Chitinimonas sp.]|uniref:YdcF family protein n=1 Tax=Chitinimonas sp. TaxID=1934313 RepID=UPI0035B10978